MEGEPGDVAVTSVNQKNSTVTGSGRKIRDSAADWHNLLIRWEKLNGDGFSAAANIVNIRRTEQVVDEPPTKPPSSLAAAVSNGAAQLQQECSKLQDCVEKMVSVVTKMKRLTTSQCGIQDLEEFHFGAEGRTRPLFHTWKTKEFESTSCFLLDSFSQELQLKQIILQELAHTPSADLCMVYLSCWLHQPLTPPQARMALEALLLETGHRPL